MNARVAAELDTLRPALLGAREFDAYPRTAAPAFPVFAQLKAREAQYKKSKRYPGRVHSESGLTSDDDDSDDTDESFDDSDDGGIDIDVEAASELMAELEAAGILTPYTVLQMAEYHAATPLPHHQQPHFLNTRRPVLLAASDYEACGILKPCMTGIYIHIVARSGTLQ